MDYCTMIYKTQTQSGEEKNKKMDCVTVNGSFIHLSLVKQEYYSCTAFKLRYQLN